ncbi:hypothetical protein MXB_1372, partial [Myxobolus squamalis]
NSPNLTTEYDANSYLEYECHFVPALIEKLYSANNIPLSSFVLRYNPSIKEIEYTPTLKTPLNTFTDTNVLDDLSEKCYFDDDKAFLFLHMILKKTLKKL